ncbi:MAG: hypothetical protein ABI601_16760 [bacterium]
MKKQGYDAELTRYRSAFAKWAAGKKFDLIVGVPSSRADSQPYVATIATASAGAKNISECFAKQAGTKAGEDPDAEKLRDAISSDLPDLATVTSVVVVDDTIKTGTTIQVILERLYAAGLSRNADIVLVAPLVLIPVEEPA